DRAGAGRPARPRPAGPPTSHRPRRGGHPTRQPPRMSGSVLGDQDLSGLDDDGHLIAGLESELFGRGPGDGGDDLETADGDDHFGHDTAEFHRLDAPLELVPCAQHVSLLAKDREFWAGSGRPTLKINVPRSCWMREARWPSPTGPACRVPRSSLPCSDSTDVRPRGAGRDRVAASSEATLKLLIEGFHHAPAERE